nr:hypothetical protein [Clostridia bacterium]
AVAGQELQVSAGEEFLATEGEGNVIDCQHGCSPYIKSGSYCIDTYKTIISYLTDRSQPTKMGAEGFQRAIGKPFGRLGRGEIFLGPG